ncbi:SPLDEEDFAPESPLQ-amide [Caenorhabditis elegans]|uniref:Isoform b of FMRFamide-like neuropeptides 11 n=1 Tax=Caenorhabditis elegans TaxID=6239 RepID=Q21156-2|nr:SPLDEEDFAPESPLQ-amide [Caenorhabditis elegans]AAC08949.1 FMRFamide-like peptide 11b [Caenorhabditis elegans]CCD68561.1 SPLDEEDFAPESPLQ-amide [Caenorhabditis elegans]|eukprot:NP_001024753.1 SPLDEEDFAPESPLQ-amide [Caenorhabditis elegans]
MTQFSALALLLIVFVAASFAQSYDDVSAEKRAMRNALVRFGRASGGMRNALVRFGKRSPLDEEDFAPESPLQGKRNGAPQPFEAQVRQQQVMTEDDRLLLEQLLRRIHH